VSDAEIEQRVADLIGRANSRQLWLLFLDEFAVQLPLLIPIESFPSEPSVDEAEGVILRTRELMGEIGASEVVIVLERYGAPTLTAQDAAWARALHAACEGQCVALRAQLLSHRTGVRWIAADEWSAGGESARTSTVGAGGDSARTSTVGAGGDSARTSTVGAGGDSA
jgi:hypothetical protein